MDKNKKHQKKTEDKGLYTLLPTENITKIKYPIGGFAKIRLISVKAEKRKFGISVIDLTAEVKYLRLMVIQLYFFSFGISYLK